MSGGSNVSYWLEQHGIESSPDLVQRILQAAKQSPTVLTETEVMAVVGEHRRRRQAELTSRGAVAA
jgi:hypothetical protein